jgi:hypothetical protein
LREIHPHKKKTQKACPVNGAVTGILLNNVIKSTILVDLFDFNKEY